MDGGLVLFAEKTLILIGSLLIAYAAISLGVHKALANHILNRDVRQALISLIALAACVGITYAVLSL